MTAELAIFGVSYPEWQKDALCQDYEPETFFPERSNKTGSLARQICNKCPVKQECLDWTLEIEKGAGGRHGFFGGTSPKERYEKYRMCKLPNCKESLKGKPPQQMYCTPEHSKAHVEAGGIRRTESYYMKGKINYG